MPLTTIDDLIINSPYEGWNRDKHLNVPKTEPAVLETTIGRIGLSGYALTRDGIVIVEESQQEKTSSSKGLQRPI